MKRLPPTLRNKRRYLRFRIRSEEDVEIGDVVNAFWSAGLEFLGSSGMSKIDMWVLGNKFDEDEQSGVVRVNRDMEDEFRAALVMVQKIGGAEGFVEVTASSGSVKEL